VIQCHVSVAVVMVVMCVCVLGGGGGARKNTRAYAARQQSKETSAVVTSLPVGAWVFIFVS
jgi:hypothetical protein